MSDQRKTESTVMNVSELVGDFKKGVIQIPEIQRDVVWGPDDVIKLIESVCHDYPCGSLILWEPRLRDISMLKDMIRPEILEYFEKKNPGYSPQYFLIDGQQRLTALASIILGSDFLNKREPEAEYDWPQFYIDIKSLKPENIEASPDAADYKFPWFQTNSLFDISLDNNPEYRKLSDDKRAKVREFCDRIWKYHFPVQIIKGFDYPTVGSIFERVNSQGTQLTGAEIHIARIIPHWKGITKEFRSYLRSLKRENQYTLDLTFLIRCLATAVTDTPKIENFSDRVIEEQISRHQLNSTWKESKRSINKLIKILKKDGFVETSKYITSRNAFIPLFYCLFKNDKKTTRRKALLKFFFLSHLGGHYSYGTEGVLRKDLRAFSRERPNSALEEICNRVKDEACDERKMKGMKLPNSEIKGTASKNPVLLLVYAALIKGEAKDFSLTNSALVGDIPADKLSVHHIFPSKFMQNNEAAKEYKSLKKLSTSEFNAQVSDIANLTIISNNENSAIGENAPFEYLENVTTKENRKAHFIPLDKELWKPQNFDKFLDARRKLLQGAVNKILRKLK